MSYDIEGKIHAIFPKEVKSEKFQFQELVIAVQDGSYMQHVKFQFTQDRTDLLANFKEGDSVSISFNIKGREWNGKYFVTLDGWRIKPANSDVPVMAPPDPSKVFNDDPFDGAEFPTHDPSKAKVVADDLPF